MVCIMDKIIFLLWVSWAGKTVLINDLLFMNPNLILIPSYTSRPPRDNEKDGRKYYFLSSDEFEDNISRWKFLEYTTNRVNSYRYGTKIKDVEMSFNKSLTPISETSIGWLQHIQRNSNFPWNYTSIFLDIPDELIRHRLRERGRTTEENIAKRIIMASDQRALARDICSYYLDASGTLAECVQAVNEIIIKETS